MAQHVTLELNNRYCDKFSITDALLDCRSHIDSVADVEKLLWAPSLQRTRALTIIFADRKLRQTYYTKITLTY